MYKHENLCKYVFKKRKTDGGGGGGKSHVSRAPRKAKSSFNSTWHHLASLIVQSGPFFTQKGND